jgi:anti-sigma B factor antagonist
MPDLTCRLQGVKGFPGFAVVTIYGSIDPRNLESLSATLAAARGRGFRTLVLDLAEIRYINSAGLSYLVNLSDILASRGGGLHLANPQPKVKVVFELMGITQFFKLHKTVDAALRVAIAQDSRRFLKVRPAASDSRRG